MASLSKLYTRKQIDVLRQELINKYGDKCSICSRPPGNKRLSVDHNHRTGQVRGLLCFKCNKFLVGRHSLTSAWQVYDYLLKFDPKGG